MNIIKEVCDIIKHADYVDSIFHTSYQGPFQFKQADQFMLEHSDQTLLIYDEEQEASPKFFKQMLVDFMDKTNLILVILLMSN